MKPTTLLLLVALVASLPSMAQTPINKTVEAKPGQQVVFHFDYPEMVRVSTWDKNEISIQGTVSINSGESDDAFELLTSTSGNTISISNVIRDMKNLPHHITVTDGAQKITFKDKAALKKYQDEHGKAKFESTSWGLDIDIVLEIKVPRNFQTRVESVYGMVEIRDFTGPLTVEATYGGVDASLVEKAAGEVVAETNYGEIFTNLDTKFGGESSRHENFHTLVSAKPGNGPKYSFESKYGNVYIRKSAP